MRSILPKLRSAPSNLAFATLLTLVASTAHADGAWVLETVDNSGGRPYDCAYTSIAIDPQGVPRVCYSWNVDPRVATRTPSGWTYEQLTTPPHAAAAPAALAAPELLNICYPTLAVDPLSGQPRVAYVKVLPSQEWFAERAPGGGWSFQYVSWGDGSPQLAIDALGDPHLMIGTNYWTRTGGTWGYETVGAGSFAPIRMDHQGRPRSLLMGGYPTWTLQYASRESGAWDVENLGGPVNAGAIALDGADNPCIAYYDAAAQGVRYRYRDHDAWVIESVTNAHAGFVSLALGGAGQPFIAYSDSFGGNHLCFARRSGGPGTPWITETVDGSYECGLYCSLTIDAAGRPHIAYYESPTQRARYAMLPAAVTFAAPPTPAPFFRLARAFPNPLRSGGLLLLDFRLPAPRTVSVELLDVAGQVVARHEPASLPAGDAVLPWTPVLGSSGLYFLRATTNAGETAITRLALTR